MVSLTLGGKGGKKRRSSIDGAPLSNRPKDRLLIFPHRVDENFRQLGTRVLGRRWLAGAKKLAPLGARYDQAILVGVRTGFVGRHGLALLAKESVFEIQQRDADF